MFGLWYIVFGLVPLAIIALVCMILFGKLYDKNYALLEQCCDTCRDRHTKTPEERNKAKIEIDKCVEKIDIYETENTVFAIISAISLTLIVMLIIVSIFLPIRTKREVREYEYNKEYIEFSIEAVQDDSDYFMITGDIFEYNKWLADAKSRVDTLGCFSSYYGLVEDLEPIRLPTKTAD